MREEKLGVKETEVKPRIAWEVFKVGGITFGITAIAPLVLTIIFLANYWSQIRAWSFTYNGYGEIKAGVALGNVIFSWLIISLPLTITNTIGKRLMYTSFKETAPFLMPVVAVLLVIGFVFLGIWITGGLS